jgi:hypothetical protein
VPDLLDRHPRQPGAGNLRSVIEEGQIGVGITREELEHRFLAFLDDYGLPRPLVNQVIEGFEVDCVWPEHRLIVELDSRATHGTTATFERDRERDRILQTAGWRVVRVAWRQLHRERGALASDLRTLTLPRP